MMKCKKLVNFTCVNLTSQPHLLCQVLKGLQGCESIKNFNVIGTHGETQHERCFDTSIYSYSVEKVNLKPLKNDENNNFSFLKYFPRLKEITFRDYKVDMTSAFLVLGLSNCWLEIINWKCTTPLPGIYLASVYQINLYFDIPIPQFFVANRHLRTFNIRVLQTIKTTVNRGYYLVRDHKLIKEAEENLKVPGFRREAPYVTYAETETQV